jgi:PHP family Zn ribbon phosphoesterase
MSQYYYDLHVHSCLSPCADDDMTVHNIAGMAALKGLQIVALTDHNTCGNCRSFYAACKRQGIIPIAGMELTTAEEIHLICLFEELESAEAFEKEFKAYRLRVRNRVEIFGHQYYVDENDEVCGEEPDLLPPASALSLEEACRLAGFFQAFCYPAHVDRPSNGIINILGDLPESPAFSVIEYSSQADVAKMEADHPSLRGKKHVTNSDAHHLWDISEAEHALELADEPYSSSFVRRQLFRYLREGTS